MNILTPNSLLLGRVTAKNLGGWQSGRDGKVRRVSVMYKNFRVGDKILAYKGHNEAVIVHRSTQRLALLVPVNDD